MPKSPGGATERFRYTARQKGISEPTADCVATVWRWDASVLADDADNNASDVSFDGIEQPARAAQETPWADPRFDESSSDRKHAQYCLTTPTTTPSTLTLLE